MIWRSLALPALLAALFLPFHAYATVYLIDSSTGEALRTDDLGSSAYPFSVVDIYELLDGDTISNKFDDLFSVQGMDAGDSLVSISPGLSSTSLFGHSADGNFYSLLLSGGQATAVKASALDISLYQSSPAGWYELLDGDSLRNDAGVFYDVQGMDAGDSLVSIEGLSSGGLFGHSDDGDLYLINLIAGDATAIKWGTTLDVAVVASSYDGTYELLDGNTFRQGLFTPTTVDVTGMDAGDSLVSVTGFNNNILVGYAVPEPSTIGLLIAGGVLTSFLSRKRFGRQHC